VTTFVKNKDGYLVNAGDCAGELIEGRERIAKLEAELAALKGQRDQLLDTLERVPHAYVSLIESARDRIMFYGGECDSVEDMERDDPFLRALKDAIARVKGD